MMVTSFAHQIWNMYILDNSHLPSSNPLFKSHPDNLYMVGDIDILELFSLFRTIRKVSTHTIYHEGLPGLRSASAIIKMADL